VVVLKQVILGKIGIAEGATMVTINSFVDATTAIDVPTPRDVAVIDLVEADVAQELLLQGAQAYLEIAVATFLLHSD